jgi:hypothetical protein
MCIIDAALLVHPDIVHTLGMYRADTSVVPNGLVD